MGETFLTIMIMIFITIMPMKVMLTISSIYDAEEKYEDDDDNDV